MGRFTYLVESQPGLTSRGNLMSLAHMLSYFLALERVTGQNC